MLNFCRTVYVVMTVTIFASKRWSVRLYRQLFVGGCMSYILFICLRIVVSNTCFVLGFFLRFVYPMLPVSLDCPVFIAPSVLSNVYSSILCHLSSTLFIVCKFVLVTNTADLVLNNNQLIWCDNFTFLFYCNRVLFLHWKGNKSVIRFLQIVLVRNIVLEVVVCGPLLGQIIHTHAVHNATFVICVIINIADIQFT